MSFQEFCRVLKVEAQAIEAAASRFESQPDQSRAIEQALSLILDRTRRGGKLITLGVGKSGKIAAKFSATLSSTGTPSIYLHPTEALHGDLGILHDQDTVFAMSHTGNTEELVSILPFFEARKLPIIGLTGGLSSKLAEKSQIVIDGSVAEEACGHNLAPTSSTTLALAITDALAVALMKSRGFTAEDFAKNHPGGSLGRRLQLRVADLMHPLTKVPVAQPTADMEMILDLSTRYKLGAVLILEAKKLKGIITDGDIRRALKHRERFFKLTAQEVMTANPITGDIQLLAYDALRLMEERESQINVLPITNTQGDALGLLRIHDLVQTL
jgi:arabinose-5-phosphate isomerase